PLLPPTKRPQRPLQGATVTPPRQPYRQRDRIGRPVTPSALTLQPVEEPQPTLRKRQRHLARTRKRTQRRAHSLASLAQTPRQPRHRRRLKQAADRQLHIKARTDAADQPHRQQRMPTKRKELLIRPDRPATPPPAPPPPPPNAPHNPPPGGGRGTRRSTLAPSSGAGSALRSSLPFAVSGRRSRATNADGTM